MKKVFLLSFTIILISTCLCFSQNQNAEGKKITRQLTKWEKKFVSVRYGDNIYKTGSNWLTAGLGLGYHTNKDVINRNVALTYFHRFRGMYFNLGLQYNAPITYWDSPHMNGKPKFFFQYKQMEKLTDFHLGAGLRFEKRWYNFGFFIGPSYAITYIPYIDNKNISKAYVNLGAVTQIQFTYKFLYDLGIGTTLFGSFNKRYQVIGLQLHLYFSNAFKMKY